MTTPKTCKTCGKTEPETRFYASSGSTCVPCVLARQKARDAERRKSKAAPAKPAATKPATAPVKPAPVAVVPSADKFDATRVLAVLLACGKVTEAHIANARRLLEE